MFFLPLAITQILILTTHSLFNAGLARLPSPEIYISAFAVAKSLMHLFQSPVNMTRQTVTALVVDKESFKKTSRFSFFIALSVVAMLLFISFTGISRWVFENIMGLEGRTLDAAVIILRVLAVFPGLVAIRDFFSGIIIKFNATPLITMASVFRIICGSVFIAYMGRMTAVPAAVLAGLMFLVAISAEALVIFLGTKRVAGNIKGRIGQTSADRVSQQTQNFTYKYMFFFFIPLALTAYIYSSAMPVINSGLARTLQPEISISVFSIAWGLGMIFISPCHMFQQVPINFLEPDNEKNMRGVRHFSNAIGIFLSVLMVLVSFTGVGYYIVHRLIGVTHEMTVLSLDVLKLLSVMPLISIRREFYYGVLMKRRRTKYIGKGKIVNIITLVVVIVVMTFIGPSNSAVVGAVGILGCELAEVGYLHFAMKIRYN